VSRFRGSRRRFLRNSVYAASAIAGTAISSIGLSQCGLFENGTPAPSPTDTVTPPLPQGNKDTLYIYGWTTYVNNEEVVRGFTKETGIKVMSDTYDSLEVMVARMQALGKGASYSIIYPSDITVSLMTEIGMLWQLDKSAIPNLINIDEKFLDPTYDPKSAHSIPVNLGTTGIAYNVKAVKAAVGEEPTDWSDLWKYREKLRITLLNDIRSVMGVGLRVLGYSINTTDPSEIEQAYKKLQELKPSIASFETDAWRDRLIAGDLAICHAYSGDGLSVARQDPNIKYILPSSGADIWTDTVAIPKTAPNLEAAYKWINYTLKPEVAAKLINDNSFGTTNKAALPQVSDELKAIPAWSPSQADITKAQRQVKVDPQALRIYEDFWTKLTTT